MVRAVHPALSEGESVLKLVGLSERVTALVAAILHWLDGTAIPRSRSQLTRWHEVPPARGVRRVTAFVIHSSPSSEFDAHNPIQEAVI